MNIVKGLKRVVKQAICSHDLYLVSEDTSKPVKSILLKCEKCKKEGYIIYRQKTNSRLT